MNNYSKIIKSNDNNKFDSFFDQKTLRKNIKSYSVRGLTFTFMTQGIKLCLQIIFTVTLARLLTPMDFGLIAMVTAITKFLSLFKDIGLSMAIIQRPKINHKQITNIFWINILLSISIMLITVSLAPIIASFYKESQLIPITIVLSIIFILGGLTNQHRALLNRIMRFDILGIIEIISLSLGIAIAIISALYGAGYWALVLMEIGIATTVLIGVWLFCDWRPGLPSIKSGIKPMLIFGSNLTVFNIVNYFARNLDNILIGKFWGTSQLGIYSKAYSIFKLPLELINNPIAKIVIPALSSLQNESAQYEKYYLKAISAIAFITMPLVIFMIVMSENIILLLLGVQWIEAIPVFSILGISALIQPILSSLGWLYISTGRTDRLLKWGLFSSPIIIISFIVGLPFGIIGVATSYTIVILLLSYFSFLYACKESHVKESNIFKALRPILISTLVVGMILYIFKALLPDIADGVTGLFLALAGTIIIFLSVLSIFKKNPYPIWEIIHFLKLLVKKNQ